MFCKKCGNQIEEGAAFCKKCGTPVEQAGAVSTAGTGTGAWPYMQYLRIGIVTACLLMSIATVLPYLVFDKEVARYAGLDSPALRLIYSNGRIGDGIFFILSAIVAAVFLYRKKGRVVLAGGTFSLILYFYELSQIREAENQFSRIVGGAWDMYDMISKGSGFYLLSVSVIVLFVLCSLFYLMDRKTKKRNS